MTDFIWRVSLAAICLLVALFVLAATNTWNEINKD